MRARRLPLLVTALLAAGTLVSCTSNSGSGGTSYEVKASDDACTVSKDELAAGKSTFEVENTGSDVTEVYVYGEDGDAFTKIMGEKENIGPGTTVSFTVDLVAGDYEVACKPGMKGDGIRTPVTVTGEGGEEEAAYDKELEFAVAADGSVTAPDDLTAATGDKVEFKLENDADEEYYLEVLDADSTEVGEGEAAGGSDAEFVAGLTEAGDYRVKVYADGREDEAQSFTVSVG